MTNHFPAGSLLKLSSSFNDGNEDPFDPTTVKVTIEDPDGEVNTYQHGVDAALIKDSTGVYHIDVDTTDKPGTWRYRWHSSGTGQAASANLAFIVGKNYPVT